MTATEDRTGTALSGRPVAPFATRSVLLIAGLVGVVHCVAAAIGHGYWFDEVYMLAIGRNHLDWGSADQPPLTPAIAAAMDSIFPGSIVALRIPAALSTTATVVVAALIARELGCDRRAQALAAGAQATALWTSFVGHWLTPYTLEPVQWVLLLWLLVRWMRVRDDRLLVVLGVVAGVAAMTKFQVLLLCAVLLLTVAALGPRVLLRRPLLWAGVGIGALITLPTLVWQAAHGWPQLKMAHVVAEEAGPLYGGRPAIAVQLVLFAGLAGAVLSMYGLWRLWRAAELRPYRFLGATFVGLFVVFVATGGRPYYLSGFYAVLAAAGTLGLQRRRENGRVGRQKTMLAAYGLSTAVAAGAVVLGLTPDVTGTQLGERIAQGTAAAYHSLPEQQRDRTAVFGQSYIVAAYLDGFSDRYDLPQAYSLNRSYAYFRHPPPDQDIVLYVGPTPDQLRPYFRQVRRLGEVAPKLDAWLMTGRLESWDTMWARSSTLRVG